MLIDVNGIKCPHRNLGPIWRRIDNSGSIDDARHFQRRCVEEKCALLCTASALTLRQRGVFGHFSQQPVLVHIHRPRHFSTDIISRSRHGIETGCLHFHPKPFDVISHTVHPFCLSLKLLVQRCAVEYQPIVGRCVVRRNLRTKGVKFKWRPVSTGRSDCTGIVIIIHLATTTPPPPLCALGPVFKVGKERHFIVISTGKYLHRRQAL